MFNKIFRLIFPAKDGFTIRKKYSIPDEIKLKLNIKSDGWTIITSPDLPGLITQARGTKELLDMVNDAVLTYYDVPKKVGDIVYDGVNLEGIGTISYTSQQKALQTN